MNAATRWCSLPLSLPIERDSILDQSISTDQQKSISGVIAIEGVTVLLLHYNCFVTFSQRKKTRETECAISFSLNVQYKLFLVKVQLHCCHSVVVQLHLPWCNSALSCLCGTSTTSQRWRGISSDLHLDVACCLQFSGLFCNRMCSLAGLQALQLCVVFLLFTAI